jgi:NhaP-type Na+/H+ and K+/H+ antiporters with a unique C-terminal domain
MNEASEESDIRFVQLRVGLRVSELDISRKTMIVMIRRGDKMLIPNGSTILRSGDVLLLYTKKNIRDAMDVEV